MSRVAIVEGTSPIETTVKFLEMVGTDVNSVLSGKKPVSIKRYLGWHAQMVFKKRFTVLRIHFSRSS